MPCNIQARNEGDPHLVRIAVNIARNVHDREARTVSAATRPLASRDRGYAVEALDYAADQGWVIRSEENALEPGQSKPAE